MDLNRREFIASLAAAAVPVTAARKIYLVPNFHPASCGWLTTFSKERVYCANSYLNHLDRVRDDPNYKFVMSEVNNIIAIMNFQPQRIPELRQRVAQKRVELVNGYFLESAINLSGGEALVRLGVLGLQWYRRVFGLTPRYSWNIDVCGTHEQMPQIAAGLGLEALVYTRRNPTGKTIFWSYAPDGSRILTLCPGHYSEASSIFNTKQPLDEPQLTELKNFFASKDAITPDDAPILVLAGAGDYALAPQVKKYPSEFLRQWAAFAPDRPIAFATLSEYVDAILPEIHSGRTALPSTHAGTAYDFDAFWIENPRVKTLYRRNEHALQSAEILATAASLRKNYRYPSERLYDAWILMCLNMDRNTLWGSAGGMVFVDANSWDVNDRFTWVSNTVDDVAQNAGQALVPSGEGVGLFNPLNWTRNDPIRVQLPKGNSIAGGDCEQLPDDSVLFQCNIPSTGVRVSKLKNQPAQPPKFIALPDVLETRYYRLRIDPSTGDLVSLKFHGSDRELLAGPANVIVAERPLTQDKDPGDHMPPRPERKRLATSSDKLGAVHFSKGPVAATLEITGTFYGGGAIRRTVRFYRDYPRIDFETELNDIPNYTVVVSEFPFAEEIAEIRRGIPFGFSHGAWAKPNPQLHGWTKGIVPAIRWIDYQFANGGGVALLDRGLSGRELNASTPIIYLLNAEDKYWGYPNPWLSGKGRHVLEYALLPHHASWAQSRVPQFAWEYNSPPTPIPGAALQNISPLVETSPNVIVEAIRREDNHVELRFVECFGYPGIADIKLNFRHTAAALTDLTGKQKSALSKADQYHIPVRPQQIVTLHCEVTSFVPVPEPVKAWDPFVPEAKLPALHAYDPSLIGHPPFGT
ncbi:MAG TPA: glycoside hydrolase family 38 C-terminal domain-containing protein [Bryobacteraceae bacterium]|nr:glycoside hydrolase family 38 C-terminal domain-containing protein [Bryobacteraceae bacterium]